MRKRGGGHHGAESRSRVTTQTGAAFSGGEGKLQNKRVAGEGNIGCEVVRKRGDGDRLKGDENTTNMPPGKVGG